MKTTVEIFISYCFNPCSAGSIVTAVLCEVTIPDPTPDDPGHVAERAAYGTAAQHAMGRASQAARSLSQHSALAGFVEPDFPAFSLAIRDLTGETNSLRRT